jgi:hypothetical protein
VPLGNYRLDNLRYCAIIVLIQTNRKVYMTAIVQVDGSLAIATMSLVEMLPLVEKAIKDGYKLDVESNIGCPQVLGSLHLVTMFPVAKDDYRTTKETDVTVVTKSAGEEHEKALQDALVLKVAGEVVGTVSNLEVQGVTTKVDGRKKKK